MKLCTFVNEDFESCSNPREGNTMCCASHNRVVRKQLTDSRKQAAPNKISDKRKVINEEYKKLRIDFLVKNPVCEAKIKPYCTGFSHDVHHSRGRGKYFLAVETWLPVCRNCHVYLHDNPVDAIKRGLSFSRLEIKQTT